MLPDRDRLGAALGLAAVLGNALGVAALRGVPGAYRPGGLAEWSAGALAHPRATVVSALAFTLGLVALWGWARALGGRLGRAGSGLAAPAMALGAALNAAGTLAPAVLVLHVAPACALEACAPVARALLGATLSLDALFNLLFGLGLAAAGWSILRAGRPLLGWLGLAAGLATAPVAGQIASEAAAGLLVVAGPLWLAFVAATSAMLWTGRPLHRSQGGARALARVQ
jgi:hypothetical protein